MHISLFLFIFAEKCVLMSMNYGFEAGFSMIPHSGNYLQYEDSLYLNDNIGENVQRGYLYKGIPVKLGFALGGFCVKGCCRIRVNLINYSLKAGQHIIIPKGAIIDSFSGSKDLEYVQFAFYNINYSILLNSDMIVSYRNGIMNQVTVTDLSQTALKGFLDTYYIMRSIIKDESIINKKAILGGYIYSMGHWLFCEIEAHKEVEGTKKRSRNDEVYYDFMANVQKHYQSQRNVSFYADLAHLSPKYFGQIIQKVSGRYPADWISDLVILDAKSMLLSGQYSVQQISDILNFPNSSFFAKYFKEHVGCAPGKFSYEYNSKV